MKTSDKAFEIVFHEHHRMVTAYLHSIVRNWTDAADLTQDVFVIAYKRLDTFDATRPIGPWLRGIARNVAMNHLRQHARRLVLLDSGTIESLFGLFDLPHADEAWDHRLEALDACVEQLPQQQGTVVRWHHQDDLSARAIGERLSVTEKTVFQTLWRARQNLRQCIENRLRSAEVPHEA